MSVRRDLNRSIQASVFCGGAYAGAGGATIRASKIVWGAVTLR